MPIEGAEGPILELPEVTAEQAGTYDVLVANVAGSVSSLQAELTVLVPPRILAQPQPREVRQGDAAVFDVEVIGTTPFAYQWRFNGQPVAVPNTPTLTLSAVAPTPAGPYDIIVTNIVGSATSIVANSPFSCRRP